MKNFNSFLLLLQRFTFLKNFYFGSRKLIVILTSLILIFLSIGIASQVLAQTAQTSIWISPVVGILGGTNNYRVNISNLAAANGLGGFGFKLSYDKNMLSIADSNGDSIADTQTVTVGGFLGSTGKQVDCSDAYIDPTKNNVNLKKLNFACATIGDSPNGATGNGILANIKFTAGNTQGFTNITFVSSELASNTANTYNIAHSKVNLPLRVIKCADMNGDKFVAVFDILNLAQKFGWTPSNPNWDPKYDIIEDNQVTVFDVLWGAKEFGMYCP